jgi:transposase
MEKKILKDFEISKFVVCTDAGLASISNRKFNSIGGRRFITTQSLKKLKKHLRDWALSDKGWKLDGCNENQEYEVSEIEQDEEKYAEKIFYKETRIKEDGLEQRLIVTYSLKYRNYQRKIRGLQIERAKNIIETNPQKLSKKNQNDCRRFITTNNITKDGEIANIQSHCIDKDLIKSEEQFDGFYGVCTNLEDEVSVITRINRKRWEIEECFRIMKSEFKARPVYLSKDDRIKAHFTICYLSLIIYRFLEKRLQEKFTFSQVIRGLREMNFYKSGHDGYVPVYTRSDLTDSLHETFKFRTDYQILTPRKVNEIIKLSKGGALKLTS